jgi:hypothetical protein
MAVKAKKYAVNANGLESQPIFREMAIIREENGSKKRVNEIQ